MNSRQEAVAALQARLGHTFADPSLLERALTHASVGGGAPGSASDYEVLEFIGDRVIGLLAAERLAELHPKAAEGELSVRLHGLVSGQACARVARRLDMGPALRLAGGETKMGGREKDSILGDACEAVMAAIYRDGGLEAARTIRRPPCRNGRKVSASRCPSTRSPTRAARRINPCSPSRFGWRVFRPPSPRAHRVGRPKRPPPPTCSAGKARYE